MCSVGKRIKLNYTTNFVPVYSYPGDLFKCVFKRA